MAAIGQRLLELCRNSRSEVFIVAPFMKADVVAMLLHEIPTPVSKIVFVTRWILPEIMAGVSDIEVFDQIKARGGTLLLHPCLHAKYYRFDSNCMVGSANLTRKALGFCASPNLELLLHETPELPDLIELENRLRHQAILATDELRQQISDELMRLKADLGPDTGQLGCFPIFEDAGWLPTCVVPDKLYRVYRQSNLDVLLESTIKSAEHDIKACALLPGLGEEEFNTIIRSVLESHPVVEKVEALTTVGISDEKAIQLIEKEVGGLTYESLSAVEYWEILKQWLLYFFPNKYRTRAAVEVLEQSREL